MLNVIYLCLDGGWRMEPCYLHDNDKTFRGHDWQETLDYFELQKQATESARERKQQADAELHAKIEQIIGPAREQAKEFCGGQSKRSRLRGIKENRKQEREKERQGGAWQLAPEKMSVQPGEIREIARVDQPEGADKGYVPPPRPIDKLRKLRQEKLNNA
jgi:hypothetical protein